METEEATSRRERLGALRPAGRGLALVAVAGLLSACAGSAPHTISWPGGGAPAAAHGERIRSWPQAVSSVAETMRGPLGLPLTGFSVHFFDDGQALERGLVAAGTAPEIARRAAATFDAVGRPDGVYVNERRLARSGWTTRVAILAHELGHVLQYELVGGRRSASDQWLREGFSEWISFGVLARLQLASEGRRRGDARRAVALAGAARLPALSELATWDAWVRFQAERPALPLYPYAYLAVDLLVERHGVEAVLGYFRSFTSSNDAEGLFRAAFGATRSDLDAALRAELSER
ncbi:MAG: hypothetical protein ACYC4P_08415 [Thermoanaerobaculia bacterium]